MGKGIEIPLRQTFGKGKADCYQALRIGVEAWEEEGCFVKIAAELHFGSGLVLHFFCAFA